MQEALPPKYKEYQDDWGTSAREGYEDRGPAREYHGTRRERGSPILRMLGGIAIVSGICWGTYLVTQGGKLPDVLEQNHGPVAIIGLGVICSVLGKFLRT